MTTFKWADGKRKTTRSERWAKRLFDGTVTSYLVERIELRRPSRDTLVRGGSLNMVMVAPRASHVGLCRSAYYTMDQLVYTPGGWAHNNGQSIEVTPETCAKNIKTLRRKGYRKVTPDQFREMLPESIR